MRTAGLELPVRTAVAPLQRALAEHGAAVLTAPPGSGKTTLVPLALAGLADGLPGPARRVLVAVDYRAAVRTERGPGPEAVERRERPPFARAGVQQDQLAEEGKRGRGEEGTSGSSSPLPLFSSSPLLLTPILHHRDEPVSGSVGPHPPARHG